MKRKAEKERKLTKKRDTVVSKFKVVSFPSLPSLGCGKLLDILTQLANQTKKPRRSQAKWKFDPNHFVSHCQDIMVCLYPMKSKTKSDEELWDIVAPVHCDGLFLPNGNGMYLIVGWAEVRQAYSVPKFAWELSNFYIFLRGHDFGKRFYRLLRRTYSHKLFVRLPSKPEQIRPYWEKLNADKHTQNALPEDFDFTSIGWRTSSKMHRPEFTPYQHARSILQTLRDNSLKPRNTMLLFLCIALECDFPILEAMSFHWMPCYLNVVTDDYGFNFSFMKDRSFTEIPQLHWYDVRKKTISLEDGYWDFERKTWFSVLQSCNVRLIGTEFGRISWK